MARLKDVQPVLRSVGTWKFAQRVFQQLGEDAVFTWASAMAYSWLFAIFPFVIFLLSLLPLIPERFKPNIKGQVHEILEQSVPGPAEEIIQKQADKVLESEHATAFLSFGLVLTAWGASGGMSMTMSALDKAYDIEKSRSWIWHRCVAIALTAVVATMVILVMILLPVGTAVIAWIANHGAQWHIPFSRRLLLLVNFVRYAVSLMLLLLITATIYYFGPNLKQKLQLVTPGAVFSVAVWLLLGALFRVYIRYGGEATYSRTYGTVAGLVILLLFFYIDALVLLVGAEINSEIDFALAGDKGRPPKPPEHGEPSDLK